MWSAGLLALFLVAPLAAGHGYVMEPPARNAVSGSRNGFCPHCGNGNGICGDGNQWPADSDYLNVFDGPQRTYTPGQLVKFDIKVTAHHRGHFEMSICDQRISGSTTDAQGCLNRHILERARPEEIFQDCQPNDLRGDCQPMDEEYKERWYLPPPDHTPTPGTYTMHFRIPESLSCSECTLQWRWWTANSCVPKRGYGCYFDKMRAAGWEADSWCGTYCGQCGTDDAGGCNGEEFRNCVDIAVSSNGGSVPSPTSTPSPTSATPSPTVATPSPTSATPSVTTSPTPAPSARPGVCQSLWGKCGGSGWQGPFCCTAGNICSYQDEWYSQCIPESSSGGAPTPATPEPTPAQQPAPTPAPGPSTACQAAWGKCAGSGWQGPFCCVEGYTCSFQTEFYSQCVPAASSLAQVRGKQRKRRGSHAHAFLGKDHVMFQRVMQQAFKKRGAAAVSNVKPAEWLLADEL